MSQSNYPPGVTEADIDQAAGMNGPWECASCYCRIRTYDDALIYGDKTYCPECFEHAQGKAARDALEKLIGMGDVRFIMLARGEFWLYANNHRVGDNVNSALEVTNIRTADDLVRGINELHRKLDAYKAEQAKDATLHAETMRWAGMTEEAIATFIKEARP